jgi:hypothetical protein
MKWVKMIIGPATAIEGMNGCTEAWSAASDRERLYSNKDEMKWKITLICPLSILAMRLHHNCSGAESRMNRWAWNRQSPKPGQSIRGRV